MAVARIPGGGSVLLSKKNPAPLRPGVPLLLCLVLAAVQASGETAAPPAAVARRDTLLVVGRPSADPTPLARGGLVTRIELDNDGGEDLGDLLGSLAGVQIRRYGGLGSPAVPSVHGSSAAQVRIFIDGVGLGDAESGVVDLSRLPLARYAAAEVHRGLVPARWGAGAGAGAINLISRPAASAPELKLQFGAFGDRGGRASWDLGGGGTGPSLQVMIHGRGLDNDFTYTDHRQTFTRTDDDTLAVRANADWREWGGLAAGGWVGGGLDLSAAGGFYRRDGGRPGPIGAPSPTARISWRRRDGRAGLRWRDDLVRLDAARIETEEFLFDPDGQVQPGFRGTICSRSAETTGRLTWAPVVDFGGAVPGLEGLELVAGGEGRRQVYDQAYNTLENPRRTRTTWTVFAEGTAAIMGGRLRVTPGWRWRHATDDFPPLPAFFYLDQQVGAARSTEDVSPSLGLVWEAVPGILYLQGQLAWTVRQPTWVELFGHRGGVSGNRDLVPERIKTRGVAATVRPPSLPLTCRVAGFQAETRRTIVYVQNSPGTSRPVNAGASETAGVELEIAGEGPLGLTWSGNGTWQRARDTGGIAPYDGKDLPYLPRTEWWAGLQRAAGRWRPFARMTRQSENFRDRANNPAALSAGRTVLSLGLGGQWRLRWGGRALVLDVTAEVVNLTDNDVYDVEGYPLPGRSWRTGLHLEF